MLSRDRRSAEVKRGNVTVSESERTKTGNCLRCLIVGFHCCPKWRETEIKGEENTEPRQNLAKLLATIQPDL